MNIKVKHKNGYEGILYGEHSVVVLKDGKEIMIPITEELELKEGDFIFKSQKDDKWYIRRRNK